MRSDRGPIIATIGVVAVVCLLAGTLFALHLVTPSDVARLRVSGDGWRAEGVAVTTLETRPNGLRSGDIVAAVDGRSLDAWAGDLSLPGAGRPGWRSGDAARYSIIRDGERLELPIELSSYPLWESLVRDWGQIVLALAFILTTGYVFVRRPGDPAARALLVASSGVLAAATTSSLQVVDILGGTAFWIFLLLFYGAYQLVLSGGLHFALVFPQPNPLLERHPTIVALVYLVPIGVTLVVIAATRVGAENTLDWLGRWTLASMLITTLYFIFILTAIALAYRRAREAISRAQIRLVVVSIVISTLAALSLGTLPEAVTGESILSLNQQALVGLIIPVSLAAAVLRYRLFDIDLIVNRTLVYGTLTACVIGIYVGVVGYISQALHVQGNLVVSLVATGIVAVLFQPLREWLQRGVDRMMYGERDDPYGVMERLGRRLETALEPNAVLPAIAETIAETLKLPYTSIALRQGDDFATAAAWGAPQPATLSLPLVYQSETVGRLDLAPRAPGESLSPADRRVLQGIAHQAGIAAHAVRLAGDLQRSRERIIIAREEERRRLRRDLHDGLGPGLAGLAVRIEAAKNSLRDDPAALDQLLDDLRVQAQAAIADIRRVVYDLRPPSLDELGLVSALREQAMRYGGAHMSRPLQISVAAPDRLPALPAAVEVAAYRIATEALTNVVRHAGASRCSIRISIIDAEMVIEVSDDGRGMRPDDRPGVGLLSMRERAAELGGTIALDAAPEGGARIVARLPLLD